MIREHDNIPIQETYLRHTYLGFLGVIEKPSFQLIDTLFSSLPWETWQNIKNVGIMVCLKAFVDLEVAVKQHMGWHTRNVDCVMSNHNEEKTKRRNSCLRLRPRSVFGSFGIVLMYCKVNFHIVRSALQILVIKLLPIKSHIIAVVPIHSLPWKPMIILKVRSGQNHDNKIAPQAQANFNPTAAIIMDLLPSLNNTFFSLSANYF